MLTKDQLEDSLKAVVSTNLGLQNSIGNYARLSADAIAVLTARPSTEARLARIEQDLLSLGNAVNWIQS